MSQENNEWVSLNGCNACINSHMCDVVGNCVMLTIDKEYPLHNKIKRKLIQKIRTLPRSNRDLYVKSIVLHQGWIEPEITPKIWPTDKEGKYKHTTVPNRTAYKNKKIPYGSRNLIEPVINTWARPVRLTVYEKMFIENLNKPRGNY